MDLPRTRRMFAFAERAVADVAEAARQQDTDEFSYRSVIALALVAGVGTALDAEARGHHTPRFTEWWKSTDSDPRKKALTDARHAELKRAERRHVAHHSLELESTITLRSALSIVKRDAATGEVIEVTESAPTPAPSPPTPRAAKHTWIWCFSGGALDGQEVVPFLEAYLAWLRDEIVPTAERLLDG